ncbi:sigma 54-interacting transcriptional regulator [Robertmurraya sp. DFI.2.37]|uniref:sigma 54-interacting transcriptional regulator n=1 Tax=Robertmurraya sp. DFI.2.37 TaxID=3031819 RepID=UPI00124551A0|nr:sigma 54-interacting transcriptional regulator [Robertmurraya sp. DFI.2.37]MDF1507032.1 sigma 54-interacting transcriptional regulator [Robertmurraya sp. DFI.2.37]
MAEKKRILVVSYMKNTLHTLLNQLNEIGLMEHFEFEGVTVEQLEASIIKRNSLVLVSSSIVYTMVKPYLDENTPYIITTRTINYANLREILEIPKGTQAYLVSDLRQSAEETISILEETGIELDLIPYYPQKRPESSIAIAITPGEPQFVPETVSKTINIGSRLIDISTLIEIFNFFQISPFSAKAHLSARFMQSVIHFSKELSNEIFRSTILQRSLDSIVQNIDDAVLVYNNENEIEVLNKAAIDYLKLSSQVQKQNINIIPSCYYQAIKNLSVGQENFVEINDITFYMRKKRIMVDDQVYSTLIIFREAKDYQKIEHDFRFKAKQKNSMARYRFDDIKTASLPVLEMLKVAGRLAKSDSTILILGETGTGKEVLAQAIHKASPRRYEPFVGVNFAAISESLMESELFGYEPGSFTGARKRGHIGLFEQAHLGSIFLDEIGDAAPVIQNRLLRVLQERQIMRVGGDTIIPLDVRVIAATNKNLKNLIEEGTFREDLYYRLNVLPLKLLPLRERKKDISLLINLFSKEFQEKLGREPFVFTKEALRYCEDYYWPGNVRELRNVVEYVAHISGDKVYKEDLPINDVDIVQVEEPRKELEKLKEDLLEKGFFQETVMILQYLNQAHVISAGRFSLLNYLLERGYSFSEQQLRYRLKLLHEKGLTLTQRGRGGSRITDKGKMFLEGFEMHL